MVAPPATAKATIGARLETPDVPSRFEIVPVSTPEQLAEHAPELWRLHEQRLEDDFYAAPAFLGALLRHAPGGRGVALLLAYRHAAGTRELAACAPLAPAPERVHGVTVMRSCDHNYSASGAPLLHREHAAQATRALWRWLRDDRRPWSSVCWRRVGLASLAWRHLCEAFDAEGDRWWLRDAFERPVLVRRAGFEEYLAALSAKRRASYRAARRRAEAAGDLRVLLHRSRRDPDLPHRFLRLEASGWKSAAATALACEPASAAFFRELVAVAGRRNELFFVEVRLGEQPLSLTANFVDGRRAYGFKIAVAHAARRLAPGILNVIETARLLHEDPLLELLDSSSDERAFVAPYWPDRLRYGDVLAATKRFSGRVLLGFAPVARSARERVRRWLEGSPAAAARPRAASS